MGRPFIATGRTMIDVQKGELTMRVNDQQITFNVFNALKCADDIKECQFPLGHHNELLKSKLTVDRPGKRFDILDLSARTFNPSKLSIEEPPTLALNPLPSQLKYAYLKFKKALGWTIVDIKGINLTLCI
ncbi:signal transducer and activator of transcription A-like [Gossypium australe]|uniref:Signal transducer and activator of transcription A-like n=1 Tax=Gossypium australe TaxID=47621 RepID=A0A5B6X3X9_9ROSI|nr:signal transducer and activator of transcription A-like [Gossypium australe]